MHRALSEDGNIPNENTLIQGSGRDHNAAQLLGNSTSAVVLKFFKKVTYKMHQAPDVRLSAHMLECEL